MKEKYDILELYFRILTVSFWGILLFNWVFIPNNAINHCIFNIYFLFSLVYLLFLIADNIKLSRGNNIDFLYKFISTATFIVSEFYFLLFSNNIKLLLVKSLVNSLYFYISCKKVSTSKDEEGVVGIIASILIFIFATCY
ncbi:MAG: hypothetical protein ACI3VR_03795 [Intestinibacter sp.]|uniref:hypothetical protein n=1 Tax=Intestinibacter sp. TaxID=1965304 RepID=UPI003F17AD09